MRDLAVQRTDAETAALLGIWVRGWAASRGAAPPVAHGDGWRIEVGLPQHTRRHVFPRISHDLRALGETIVEPWSYLKAFVPVDELRAALPARWNLDAQTCFMRFDGPPLPPPVLPAGYVLDVTTQGPLTAARVAAPDGSLAAAGHMAVVGDVATFDRIRTDHAHLRRGLGRAMMCALDATARTLGARRGLLAATADGHAMYRTLGWRVQSPYASAVIVGD